MKAKVFKRNLSVIFGLDVTQIKASLWVKKMNRPFLIIAAGVIFSQLFVCPVEATVTITYDVYIQPNERGKIEAAVRGLGVDSISFNIMNTNHRVKAFGNISDVQAFDLSGNSLKVAKLKKGWRIPTSGLKDLIFKYSFGTSLFDSGTYGTYYCKVNEYGAAFYNDVVFAYPDVSPQQIDVVFHKPNEWTVGTSFFQTGKDRFRVEGSPSLQADFLDNVTRMGVAEAIVTDKCDNLDLEFIAYERAPGTYEPFWYASYGNSKQEQMKEYISLNCKAIRYFKSLIGFWPSGSRLWVSTFPTGTHEVHYPWDRWMQAWPRERYPQVPHHVLHAWIWWTSNAPIRFSAEERDWIQEGLPTFYEHYLTYSLTGKSMWLGMLYTDYLIMKRAAQFGLLKKISVNTYSYNVMRTLLMDRKIRTSTGGRKSINNLLSLLGRRFGKQRKQFDRDQLIQSINDVAGTDLTGFYNRYFVGVVGSEMPPVDGYMTGYQAPLLDWLDYVLSSDTLMGEAEGYRTMFFTDLEIGLHNDPGSTDEHMAAKGSCLCNLNEFYNVISSITTPTEADVIRALSSITGVDESDFFDFYTVGGWRPSASEIQDWLSSQNN